MSMYFNTILEMESNMNLPNRLSMFRMFLIPVIILVMIFPYAQFEISMPILYVDFVAIPLKNLLVLVIFIIASITDFLDGYIARKFQLVTTFGKFIDPIADKLLVNSLLIMFAIDKIIPAVPVLIMVWRDTLVDGIRMMASQKNIIMSAGVLGKFKTVLQIVTIIVYLVSNLPFELFGLPVNVFLLWFSTFISVFSGFSYFIQAKDIILETK